jgi:hypothetical protein
MEIQKEDRNQELFMTAWRASDFYDFVRKVIENERDTSYLAEAMAKRYEMNEPMSNEEIGEQARIEYQIKLRLQNILDTIE